VGLSPENGDVSQGNAGEWQTNRSSFLSESFRQTLVSLLRTKPNDHTPVYVITSAGPGEGKTTLSANLARAMAEVGHRVLLVDADLRRPHVHSLFGAHDHTGLTDILSTTDLRQLKIEDHIQSTQVNNLSVMTHGLTHVETPALLFFSPKISEFVKQLQSRFDCILFDTAPSLPFPDARLWGKHADGIVLVVRAGMTTRQGASDACERFLNDGIPVLGTIFNDWSAGAGEDKAYYAYGQRRDVS
jgi:succinoglycan biosynthesis transport protein ExoP